MRGDLLRGRAGFAFLPDDFEKRKWQKMTVKEIEGIKIERKKRRGRFCLGRLLAGWTHICYFFNLKSPPLGDKGHLNVKRI